MSFAVAASSLYFSHFLHKDVLSGLGGSYVDHSERIMLEYKEPNWSKRNEKLDRGTSEVRATTESFAETEKLDTSLSPLNRLFLISIDATRIEGVSIENRAIAYAWKAAWFRLKGQEIVPFENVTIPIEFREYVAQRLYGVIKPSDAIISMEKLLSETYLGFFGRGPRAGTADVSVEALMAFVARIEEDLKKLREPTPHASVEKEALL